MKITILVVTLRLCFSDVNERVLVTINPALCSHKKNTEYRHHIQDCRPACPCLPQCFYGRDPCPTIDHWKPSCLCKFGFFYKDYTNGSECVERAQCPPPEKQGADSSTGMPATNKAAARSRPMPAFHSMVIFIFKMLWGIF